MRLIIHTFLIYVSAITLSLAAESAIVFEDKFEGKPAESWTWLRQNNADWCIRQNALEIHARPGDANTVQNALVRPAPDRRKGTFAIEVIVSNHQKPIQQFEQAGITWYHNGKPVFKLVKELVDGQLMIIPGRKPMTEKTVQLRLIVTADKFTAQYRPGGKGEYLTAATGKLPLPDQDEVSIQCYHGPKNAEHWIRFDDFRILALEK